MKLNRFIRISLILSLITGIIFSFSAAEEKIKKMQEIYFYAQKFYKEGKYKKAMKEYENILSLSAGHKESLRMVKLCRRKLALTADLINQALEKYNNGSLYGAFENLKLAYQKDSVNFEVRSQMAQISTEIGMEYSIIGNQKEALVYFEKARKLFPDDKEIGELIKINKSITADTGKDYEKKTTAEEIKPEKLDKMVAAFKKYQEKQNKPLLSYAEAQEKIQQMLKSSEKEKQKLYEIVKEKEEVIISILDEQKKERKRNILIIGSIIGLTVIALLFLMRKQITTKSRSNRTKEEFQKTLAEKSIEKFSGTSRKQLSEFDKKLKKLEIIGNELGGDSYEENQVALRMLESFLDDPNYDVKLKAVKVLHKIDSVKAIDMIEKIIKNEKSDIRTRAVVLLNEIGTADSVDLLLNLTESRNEEIKKIAMAPLIKILSKKNISEELKSKIKIKLEEFYDEGDWVLM